MDLNSLTKNELINLKGKLMLEYISYKKINNDNCHEVHSIYNNINQISSKLNRKVKSKK